MMVMMGSISLAKGLPTRVVLIGSCKRASEPAKGLCGKMLWK